MISNLSNAQAATTRFQGHPSSPKSGGQLPGSQGINVNIYYPTANIGDGMTTSSQGGGDSFSSSSQGADGSQESSDSQESQGAKGSKKSQGSQGANGSQDSQETQDSQSAGGSQSASSSSASQQAIPANPQQHLLSMYQELQQTLDDAEAARNSYVDKRQKYTDALDQYQQTASLSNDAAYQQATSSAPSSKEGAPPSDASKGQQGDAKSQQPSFPPANYFAPMMPPSDQSMPDPYQQLADKQPPTLPGQGQSQAEQTPSPQGKPDGGSSEGFPAGLMQDPQMMQQVAQLASQLSPQDVQALMQDPAVAQQVEQLTRQLSPQDAQMMMSALASPADAQQGQQPQGQPPQSGQAPGAQPGGQSQQSSSQQPRQGF